jgi:hypothetical protein
MVTLRCQILDRSVEPNFGKTCEQNSQGDETRRQKYGCWVCRYSGQNTFEDDDNEE